MHKFHQAIKHKSITDKKWKITSEIKISLDFLIVYTKYITLFGEIPKNLGHKNLRHFVLPEARWSELNYYQRKTSKTCQNLFCLDT